MPTKAAVTRGATFENMLARYGHFAWTTRGNSMRPLLKTGRDVVAIHRPEGRLKRFDVALYRAQGRYVLHRVLEVHEGYYIIAGDNCIHRERVRDSQIIGVMRSMTRKGRHIDVDNQLYRAYVHLWCGCFPLKALILRGFQVLKKPLRLFRRALRAVW